MPRMKPIKIYALIDPRTDEIRYVGKTNQKLQSRLTTHMNENSSCHRVHWLNQLKALGMRPKITVLENVPEDKAWQESERFWIKHLRLQGVNLTNNTSGGDGVCDLPPETRERMRQVWLGRKHSEETRARMSVVNSGRKHSEEHKQHMREIMTGRVNTWGNKVAETQRKITPETAEIIKARLAAGEMVKDLALEYGIHRTSMSKIKLGTYFVFGQKAQ
jgi:group I intron endonuclease